jgi:hypothetical protein
MSERKYCLCLHDQESRVIWTTTLMVEAASPSECQNTLLQHVALHPEDSNFQLKNRFIKGCIPSCKSSCILSLWDKNWNFFLCQPIWTLKSNCLSDTTHNASEVLTANIMEKPSTAHLKKSTGYLFLGHWTIKLLQWREEIECFEHVTH